MNKTPIVFCFENKFTMLAGVCITSLLENANEDTFYDIYIMHSALRLSEGNKDKIIKLKEIYPNCNFTFLNVKNAFKDAFEIRGISIETYYRLLIPEFIKDYDKVIYSDVDVIFTEDISHLIDLDISNYSLGVVQNIKGRLSSTYIRSIGVEVEQYFNAGFLVMNLKKINEEDSIRKKVLPLVKRKLTFQDQDILNIAYSADSFHIGHRYNFNKGKLFNKEMDSLPAVYHYVGSKPYDALVFFGDVWWEYYRKSIFFDFNFYMKFNRSHYSHFTRYMKWGKAFERFFTLKWKDF